MKYIKILLILICSPFVAKSQDFPIFTTQTQLNPSYFNPAFTGIQQNLKAGLLYRLESSGLNSSMTAITGFAELGLPKINSGFGISLRDENVSGFQIKNSAALSYAYELKLNSNSVLRLGACASFYQVTLQNIPDSINPKTGQYYVRPAESTPPILSVGTGVLYSNRNYYIGVAVNNLNQPMENLPSDPDSTYLKYVLQTGGFISMGNFVLNPYLFAQFSYQTSQILAGANLTWKKLTIGASFRLSNSVDESANFLIGLNLGKFKLCYSYDQLFYVGFVPPTPIHELSLVLQLNKPHDTSSIPMIEHFRNAY